MYTWNFDTSGLYAVPTITVDNKFKYVKCDNNCEDDDDIYKCIHGCPASFSPDARPKMDGKC